MHHTTSDLAELLNVNKDTAQRMCRDGRVRTVMAGRYYRIPESEWKRLLREGVPMRKVIEDPDEKTD